MPENHQRKFFTEKESWFKVVEYLAFCAKHMKASGASLVLYRDIFSFLLSDSCRTLCFRDENVVELVIVEEEVSVLLPVHRISSLLPVREFV